VDLPLAALATLALHFIEVRVAHGQGLEPRGVGAFQDYRHGMPNTHVVDWTSSIPEPVRSALLRIGDARRRQRRHAFTDEAIVRRWGEAVLQVPKPVTRVGRRLHALERASLAKRLA